MNEQLGVWKIVHLLETDIMPKRILIESNTTKIILHPDGNLEMTTTD